MTTKLILLAGLAAATLTAAFAATRIDAALVPLMRDQVPIAELKTLRHPWTKSQPLPASLAEAGLGPDAKVVHAALYLDGGSRFFALRDNAGAGLFFCTSKPYSQAKHDGETGWQEFFLIGATNYRDPAGVLVPRGSATEALLLQAIEGRIVPVATAAVPVELKFEHTTAAAPSLTLTPAAPGQPGSAFVRGLPPESPAPRVTFGGSESGAAPGTTPTLATERFPAALRAATRQSTKVEIRTASPLAAPVAAGDLIGRASDREKMLEEYRRRTSTSPTPRKAPTPAAPDSAPAPRQP